MPKKCTNQQPTFRVNLHVPATNWHPHRDKVISVKRPTEFEAWAHMVESVLMELTYKNARLMVGYWADAINILPPDIRKTIMTAIAHGFGLDIQQAPDEPNTIEIRLVQRYEPIVGEQKTESGIVIPRKGESGLVLPGDAGYNVERR